MLYDAIVIGIGGMGSAAAYHLASRGASVLGLEQFELGHELGSSHGVNRIIRLAYAEGSAYVPMLRRAYQLWRQIQREAGEPLLYITGGIDAGPADGTIVPGSLDSCKRNRLRHELLDSEQLRRRFPGIRFPKDIASVYQPDAGFLLSERAVLAYAAAAKRRGAEIHANEAVQRWKVQRRRVMVRTNQASYEAKKLIITAGPWASKIVPFLSRQKLAVPERQVMIWTRPRRPEYFQPGVFPIFNMEAREGTSFHHYYGFPIFGIPGFKLGKYHHLGETTDPDTMDRRCHLRDSRVLRDAIRRYFPDALGRTITMKACLFTNSPDGHFIIDHHPESDRVIIAASFSGHGFKFASVIGETLADLALEGASGQFDMGMFAIDRFR
jgi:sarcosine oxidase